MATGKRPDPRRRKNPHQHATYLKVGNGQQECGYKAGEIFGCYGHRTYAHMPCMLDLTDGEQSCPYCAARLVPEFRAYVPIWDRDWTLRYCLIGEDHFDSTDVIPHRAQVVVSRAKNPISPLVVREEIKLVRQLPDRAPWSDKVDMLAICLTLWKDPEVVQWYSKAKPAPTSDNALSQDVVDPSEKKLKRLAKAEKKHQSEQKLSDIMAGTRLDRLLKGGASANGKHDK